MNVKFSATFCEWLIKDISDDTPYEKLRIIAERHSVPSLELPACTALKNIASIKKPAKSIDIGCGIGVSSLAILEGAPNTVLTGIDGNLERLLIFNEFFKNKANVTSYQIRGEQWLSATDDMYDLAFIDSVKREYPIIWQRLRPRLNKNAVVVFDDILIYGYIWCEESEVPVKYKDNRREMLMFLNEIFSDKSISAQIIPVSGGLLVVSLI